MMKEKKKRKQCNHKHDGKIMAIGHWEPLHARLVAWAESAQTPLQEALRVLYITKCWYGPDERTRRPAFGGQIKRLSRAAFSRKYGVSSSTLERWHKEVEKISTNIKQEWIIRDRERQRRREAAMNGQPQHAANGEPLVDDDIPF